MRTFLKMKYDGIKYVVVGSGLWGSVIAERIASILNEKVLIIEKRDHVGGNCYSTIDSETGIEYHSYGTHIFHTSNKKVWDYINKFSDFSDYQHKVFTTSKNKVYSMPINLATINSFFNINLRPYEVEKFINDELKKHPISEVNNLEDKAISLIGVSLYEAFIKGYTQKQWEKEPKDLPADIITRLPVRYNYNNNYFSDKYQGMPLNGYNDLFKKLLGHPNIRVELSTDYYDVKELLPSDCKIFFSGPIDRFFEYKYGMLEWRSLKFEYETKDYSDYQGTSVMNYADKEIRYTRIHEYKHLHPERDVFNSNRTIICYEYPKSYTSDNEPYYPINNNENSYKYEKYEKDSKRLNNIIFGGRLGAYKYWDMDKAIENALTVFDKIAEV